MNDFGQMIYIIKKIMPNKQSSMIDDNQKIYFNDTVYGRIHFNSLIVKIIDTPHVQRLRKIKQMRTLQYVFPCASHYTFQHALGTAHLAKTFITKLIQNNPRFYQDENIHSIIKTITLAGLLCNIGQAPFNHIFDNEVIKTIQFESKTYKWSHELATQKLISSMIKQQPKIKDIFSEEQPSAAKSYKQSLIYRSQIDRIIRLIKGQPDHIRPWQYQIINNKKYGIDVNIIDRLKRDGLSVRADINLNVQQLIDGYRIDYQQSDKKQNIKGHGHSNKNHNQYSKIKKQSFLALPWQNLQSIYNIYRFRYMINKIYNFNVVNQGIEMMIADILKQADKIFHLRQACKDLISSLKNSRDFINLNDDILDLMLEEWQLRKQKKQLLQSEQFKSLQKACQLIHRLKNRNLYRFVYQFFYKIKEYQDEEVAQLLQELTQDFLINGISKYSKKMKQSICVNIKEIDLGAKEFNPLKKVKFYKLQKQPHLIVKKQQRNQNPMFNEPFYIEKTFKVYLKTDENNSQYFPEVEQSCQSFQYYFNQKCRRRLQSIGQIYLQQGKGGKIPNKQQNTQKLQKSQTQIKNRTPIMNTYLGDNYIDIILNWMSLQPTIWYFVDNKYFQRLRKMHQNLALHYVSPCYNNTIFEHSLGVANLARRYIKTIIQNNPVLYNDEGQKESAIKTITLAALLFSLGYTPFNSYLAKKQKIRNIIKNSQVLKLQKKTGLNDEDYSKYLTILQSLRLFEFMLKQQHMKKYIIQDEKKKQFTKNNRHYFLTISEIQRVKSLIIGKPDKQTKYREWQFQIVNDVNHNIDTVNIDALLRDSYHLSASNIHIDYELLMNQCRIIGDKICFPTKYTQHINNIISAKIKLFKEYYKHRQTQKLQLILEDLFKMVEDDLRLQQIVVNILNSKKQYEDQFLMFDDQILEVIEIETGKQIMKKLRQKDSYLFLQQIKYTVNPSKGYQQTNLDIQGIKQQYSLQRYMDQPGFIYVTSSSYGFSTLKTVQSVSYFKKEERQNRLIPQNQKEGLTMLRIEEVSHSLNFYIQWNEDFKIRQSHQKEYKTLKQVRQIFQKDSKEKIQAYKFPLNVTKNNTKNKHSQLTTASQKKQ